MGALRGRGAHERFALIARTVCTWLLAFGVCAAAGFIRPLARAHAQAAPERWLFVPVFAGERPKGLDPAALTGPLETALQSAGMRVVTNAAAATTFENQHSSEPAQLGNDDLRRLSRSVAQAARHLALGELPDAQRAMEGVNALSGPARDFLNRETKRARKIFDNCLMASFLWERAQQHPNALRQMLECTRGFPGFRPEGRAYPNEVRRLFEEAMREQSRAQPTSLRVVSAGKSSCGVRLNGVEIGRSPVQLAEVRAGSTRVQLECEPGAVGRIHNIELKPGENELSIDPAFDAAVRSQGALWLTYASERERDERAVNDARTIAQALGVPRLVMLFAITGPLGTEIVVRPAGTVPNRELSRANYAAASGYAVGGVADVTAALRAWARPQPAVAKSDARVTKRMPPPAGEIGEFAPPEPQPSAAAPPTPAWNPAPAPAAAPAPMPYYTQQHAAAGALLAIIGGASTAVSWVLYAERQATRRDLMERDDTAYQKLGVVTLTSAALGTTLLSLSEFFWLPDEPSVPALGWIAGGLGAALGATALALSFTSTRCTIGDTRVECQRFWSDRQFGPFLFLHALPLLTVPVWYGLRMALRPSHVQIAVNAGGLELRGQF